MKTSPRGIEDLVLSEALKTTAYRDSGGVWTIGVGHTASAGLPKPVFGMKITVQEAKDILARDLATFEAGVNEVLPRVPQAVFDGAVSFNFNTGSLRKASWPRLYKAGSLVAAEASLKQWNKVNGKVVRGLVTRRAHEADLIFRGKYRSGPAPAPVPGPAPPEPVTGDPVLRKGDGLTANLTPRIIAAVKDAQALLTLRGFSPGSPPDGMFGEKTEAMVKVFQRQRGLVSDGVIGPKTWAALRTPNLFGTFPEPSPNLPNPVTVSGPGITERNTPMEKNTVVTEAVKHDIALGKKAIVEIKPAKKSKTIWTQIIGIAVMLLSFFGLDVSPETLAQIEAGIIALMGVVTVIWKMWFTPTVTPASVGE